MKKPVWLKPLLFVVLLAPMTVLAISWVRLLSGTDVPALTADPVAETTRVLGEWSLRSLLAALAVTPVAHLTGWTPILTARRLVGRSEEHTSELQSLMRISYAVFCLKKK